MLEEQRKQQGAEDSDENDVEVCFFSKIWLQCEKEGPKKKKKKQTKISQLFAPTKDRLEGTFEICVYIVQCNQ